MFECGSEGGEFTGIQLSAVLGWQRVPVALQWGCCVCAIDRMNVNIYCSDHRHSVEHFNDMILHDAMIIRSATITVWLQRKNREVTFQTEAILRSNVRFYVPT